MDSYQQKIDKAQLLFKQYNDNIEVEAEHLKFDIFLAALKKAGGFSLEALTECSYEDIERFGIEISEKGGVVYKTGNLPKLLAKQIARNFRSTELKEKTTAKKAKMMNLRELLQAYSPYEQNTVSKRLSALSKGQPCVIFDKHGEVSIDNSLICFEDIKAGCAARDIYVGEYVYELHHIGQAPLTAMSENPLFPGHTLRGSQEVCDITHRSWYAVAHKVRVLLRLALETKELVVDEPFRAHDILDLLIKNENSMLNTVAKRAPKAVILYKVKGLEESLPSLKIIKNKKTKNSLQDPFFQGHKSY